MKILRTLAIAALALTLTACSTPETKFSRTVDDIEKRADRMSEKDWERTDRSLEKMYDSYKANPDRLSDEEWASVNMAYAKYGALKAKYGIKKAAKDVEEFFEEEKAQKDKQRKK